jgi:hypothetical protein
VQPARGLGRDLAGGGVPAEALQQYLRAAAHLLKGRENVADQVTSAAWSRSATNRTTPATCSTST